MQNIISLLKDTSGSVTVENAIATFSDGTQINLQPTNETFLIERWEPSRPGFSKRVDNQSFDAVVGALSGFMDKCEFYYEWIQGSELDETKSKLPIPEFRQLVVNAYPGSSEGTIIEIGAFLKGKIYLPIAVIKTFEPLADCFLFGYRIFKFLAA